MDARIIVCTHKPYDLPEDDLYLPLQVGAAISEPIDRKSCRLTSGDPAKGEYLQGDDTGENISEKNGTFCELTGLYWAWRNLDHKVLGLVHYRRQFTVKSAAFIHRFGKMRALLTADEVDGLFRRYDIIVPTKRRYYIETLFSHYDHTLDGSPLLIARDIIAKHDRGYLPFLERVYRRRWGYMFNMMLMRKEEIDAYCTWLFDILDKMEERLAADGTLDRMTAFEKRLFGRVSEILFNVWLEKRRVEGVRIGEVKYLPMENEQWHKKIPAFLAAKFTGKKYKGSFG